MKKIRFAANYTENGTDKELENSKNTRLKISGFLVQF